VWVEMRTQASDVFVINVIDGLGLGLFFHKSGLC
jgi:hypothetical protein